jgi:hypothetical protein
VGSDAALRVRRACLRARARAHCGVQRYAVLPRQARRHLRNKRRLVPSRSTPPLPRPVPPRPRSMPSFEATGGAATGLGRPARRRNARVRRVGAVRRGGEAARRSHGIDGRAHVSVRWAPGALLRAPAAEQPAVRMRRGKWTPRSARVMPYGRATRDCVGACLAQRGTRARAISAISAAPGAKDAGGAHSPGANVVGVSAVHVQMWQGQAQSRCRCAAQGVSPILEQMWPAICGAHPSNVVEYIQ